MIDPALIEKTPQQLQAEDIARQALEIAATTLEQRAGNEIYQRAWRAAAKVVRSLKLT